MRAIEPELALWRGTLNCIGGEKLMRRLLPLISRLLVSFVLLICTASLMAEQAPKKEALHNSTQMLVVTTSDWSAVPGRLVRYERARPGKHWKQVGGPVAIVVGKNGLGWGIGLAPTDNATVRDSADPVKHEGDGKSPAGVFGISTGFGYSAEKPAAWKMPYVSLTPTVECVDDAGSQFYNRVVDRAAVTLDWNSSEHMASTGEYYRWGAVIDHNWNPPVPGAGSCIFLHVWGGPSQGTTGCTAMAQLQLEPILAWLDPAANPILVQLPQAQYKKLRKPWRLPKLPQS